MKMPFGKHRGVLIQELPDDYLEWLRSLDDLRKPLRQAVEREWNCRQAREEESRQTATNFGSGLNAGDRLLLGEVLRTGYRALALKYHPDVGGAAETMLRLNRLMERLRQEYSSN